MTNLQVTKLHAEIDALQKRHGSMKLSAIYGAGCMKQPDLMLVFMNPTGKNVSASPDWKGLRAPWLGTKNVWKILYKFGLISESIYATTQRLLPGEWTSGVANTVYDEVAKRKLYITNLAKCTQNDAKHLKDSVFKDYLELMRAEITEVNPKSIITFGNQVSSVLLGKPITVSKYQGGEVEILGIGKKIFNVYPTYYPVGQGQRNMPLAFKRLQNIMKLL